MANSLACRSTACGQHSRVSSPLLGPERSVLRSRTWGSPGTRPRTSQSRYCTNRASASRRFRAARRPSRSADKRGPCLSDATPSCRVPRGTLLRHMPLGLLSAAAAKQPPPLPQLPPNGLQRQRKWELPVACDAHSGANRRTGGGCAAYCDEFPPAELVLRWEQRIGGREHRRLLRHKRVQLPAKVVQRFNPVPCVTSCVGRPGACVCHVHAAARCTLGAKPGKLDRQNSELVRLHV